MSIEHSKECKNLAICDGSCLRVENTTETAKHVLATIRDAKKSLRRIMENEMPYHGES